MMQMCSEVRPKNPMRSSVFCRELLPSAASFYANELGKLSRSSRDWAIARCCFHKPDRNPSLSVNLTGGGFVCFSCQARGGSIIDFLMLRDGIDFTIAAKRLGAWRDQDLTENDRSHLAEQRRERNRTKQAAIDLARAEHELRIGLRDEVHFYERVQREIGERMKEPATSAADMESCWRVLELLHDELRAAVAGYSILSFGTVAEREEFVRNPEWRDHAIRGVLDRGLVRDDAGHIVEVAFS